MSGETASRRTAPTAGDAMLHPAILAALALLIVNDHVLKELVGAHPVWSVVTGKLSDAAGLAFFPALLFSITEVVRRRAPASARVVVVCAVGTALFFAGTKLVAPVGDCYRYALAALQWPVYAVGAVVDGRALPPLRPVQLVMDPTDLVCLPFVAVAVAVGRRRARAAPSALHGTDAGERAGA